jgi:hypothetical protein
MPVSFLATLAALEAEDAARVPLPFLRKAGPGLPTSPPTPAPLAKAAFVPPDRPLTLEPASLGPLVGPTAQAALAAFWAPAKAPAEAATVIVSGGLAGDPPEAAFPDGGSSGEGVEVLVSRTGCPAAGPTEVAWTGSTGNLGGGPGDMGGEAAAGHNLRARAGGTGRGQAEAASAASVVCGGPRLPASVASSSGAAAAAQDLATLVDESDDEEMPLGSTRTNLDFYGRPMTGPLSTASTASVPDAPRKIYRVGRSTFIGQRHENGVRVIRYLDYGYGPDSQSM